MNDQQPTQESNDIGQLVSQTVVGDVAPSTSLEPESVQTFPMRKILTAFAVIILVVVGLQIYSALKNPYNTALQVSTDTPSNWQTKTIGQVTYSYYPGDSRTELVPQNTNAIPSLINSEVNFGGYQYGNQEVVLISLQEKSQLFTGSSLNKVTVSSGNSGGKIIKSETIEVNGISFEVVEYMAKNEKSKSNNYIVEANFIAGGKQYQFTGSAQDYNGNKTLTYQPEKLSQTTVDKWGKIFGQVIGSIKVNQ